MNLHCRNYGQGYCDRASAKAAKIVDNGYLFLMIVRHSASSPFDVNSIYYYWLYKNNQSETILYDQMQNTLDNYGEKSYNSGIVKKGKQDNVKDIYIGCRAHR